MTNEAGLEFEQATERETVYLRKVDADTDNECWVVCLKGDPGAVKFEEALL